ncbi:thiol peroxidase [Arcanobacterium pluranimalium]|uniref:thiol peroxidase n=1 Tax=Arcanobacterium pluranimalium TaxID=108028 RepID=UPI0019583BC1|nr:thiol peroxidase [Arcanobacterium pluranimalium]MBM7824215.1 thiol peroxidase [Arcanobacterium pluranimalium]
MATTHFKGQPVNTCAELPELGQKAQDFVLTATDLSDVKLSDYAGRTVVLNIFPSVDTGVCAQSVREFNKRASELDNTTVLCISKDLPFALDRFCAAEGLDNVVSASAFRSDFPSAYGVEQIDGPLRGLLARTVVVINPDGNVSYTELVPEIATEPDYDAALAAI